MTSKIGFHLLGRIPDWEWLQDYVRRVRPTIIKVMEGATDEQYWGLWEWCKQNGILVIGRKYVENQDAATPEGLAGAIIDLVRRGCPVKIWEGLNEPQIHSQDQAVRQARFDLAMANLLHAAGVRYAADNSYHQVMNYVQGQWVGHFYGLPEVQGALSAADYHIYHQYSHYPMDYFLDHKEDGRIWINGAWGQATWWVGREKIWLWLMRQINPAMVKPILNTETGIETYSGSGKPPWGGDRQGGAWSYTGPEEYAREIARVDAEVWQQIPELKGCCVYTHGTNNDPRWDSYNTATDAGHRFWESLVAHIAASHTQPTPEPIPPAAPPPPPEPTGEVEDITDLLPRDLENGPISTRALSSITDLIIHHTASDPSVTPLQVANWHVVNEQGPKFPCIGYHFFIAENGMVYQTARLEEITYHAGPANAASVGIVLAGRFDNEDGVWRPGPPQAQLEALEHLVEQLMVELDLGVETIKAHYEVNATACPGEQWFGVWRTRFTDATDTELRQLRQRVAQQALEIGLLRARIGRIREITEE